MRKPTRVSRTNERERERDGNPVRQPVRHVEEQVVRLDFATPDWTAALVEMIPDEQVLIENRDRSFAFGWDPGLSRREMGIDPNEKKKRGWDEAAVHHAIARTKGLRPYLPVFCLRAINSSMASSA
jgi:hypothetical protein